MKNKVTKEEREAIRVVNVENNDERSCTSYPDLIESTKFEIKYINRQIRFHLSFFKENLYKFEKDLELNSINLATWFSEEHEINKAGYHKNTIHTLILKRQELLQKLDSYLEVYEQEKVKHETAKSLWNLKIM